GEAYPIRALVAFGANVLMANGDTLRGQEALERLEFFAQVELFHTPTSHYADVLLPAASFLESEALKVGNRYPIESMADVRRRPRRRRSPTTQGQAVRAAVRHARSAAATGLPGTGQ